MSLLRTRSPDGHAKVGFIELFFDLVYVFAITQLAHFLLEHHDTSGLLQSLVMFLAIWWAWMYTSWATNWADVERAPVRVMLGVLMLISLFMSAAIPRAFGDGGLMFAGAYVGIQVGRTLFMTAIMRADAVANWRNMLRILIYFLLSAPLWLVGAFTDDPTSRLLWWAGALAIEYAGPMLLFRFPGLGHSTLQEWNISGAHMAERAGLFIIIALGEGIIVTGATFAALSPDASNIVALSIAVTSSFAMWWIYFDVGAAGGAAYIEHQADPGAIARLGYTYLHIPIVAGIVVIAVSDERLIAHPTGHFDPVFLASLIGGLGLFLTGTAAFKWLVNETVLPPLSHLVGLLLVAALGLWGWMAHPQSLTLGAASIAVLITVALWEWLSLKGGKQP